MEGVTLQIVWHSKLFCTEVSLMLVHEPHGFKSLRVSLIRLVSMFLHLNLT